MIQQIVAKKTLTKKWQIIIKNVLDYKSTDQLAVHFLFYKKNILLIVLYDCKIIKRPSPRWAGVDECAGAGANNFIV